jgi:hypothetical protein
MFLYYENFETRTVLPRTVGRMMNEKVCARKRSWPTRGIIPAFAGGAEENN